MAKYLDTFFFLCLCLMIISFPFSIALNSILLGAFSFVFIVDYKNILNNVRLYFQNGRNILLLIIFLSLLVSVIYSDNKKYGLLLVLDFLPYIVLPLTLVKLKGLPPSRIKILKRLHILVCFAASAICIIWAIKTSGWLDGSYRQLEQPQYYTQYFVYRFTYHQFSSHLGLHAIHFSLFIAMAVYFTVEELKSGNYKKKLALSFLLLYFVAVLVLLKATAVNFALYSGLLVFLYATFTFKKWYQYVLFLVLTVFATVIVSYLFTLKSMGQFELGIYLFDSPEINKSIITFLITALVIASLAVIIKPTFKKKYVLTTILAGLGLATIITGISAGKKISEYISSKQEAGVTNVNARLGSWKADWLLIKEHPLWGVGMGDQVDMLIKTYKETGFEAGIQQKFDAHSQYFQFWISSGLVSFLAFSILLLSEMFKALRRGNWLLPVFLYCLAILCFSESVMNAQLGRTFFVFFMCFLYYSPKQAPSQKSSPIFASQ